MGLFKKRDVLQEAIDAFPYPFYIIDIETYSIETANAFLGIDLRKGEYKCHKVTHKNNVPCSGKKDPCPIAEMKVTKKPVVVEHVHYNSKGEARDVRVYAFPIFSKKGKLEKMIEYSIDITKEKKLEKEARKHEKELERLNGLMVGRELKMVELKEEIEALRNKI